MTTLQKTTESRTQYLRRVRRYARQRMNDLLRDPEYRYAHRSHAVAKAMHDAERQFPDLGTFGVEYIPAGSNQRSPAITYLNAGDTYAETLLYIRGTFRVGDWGSIVERGNYE